MPVAGSAYTYAYATLGEFVAWIIGWDLILEYALGAATVAVGWSGNLVTLLQPARHRFPAALSAAPGTLVPVAGGDPVTAVFNLPAVLITVAVTALLIFGVSESATVNSVIVVIKVARRADRHRRRRVLHRCRRTGTRSFPRTPGHFGEYGWSGMLRGAGVIFFAYIGFDAVSTSAQEAQESAARHAARHPRIAGGLHRALRAGVGGDGRPRAVQGDAEPGRRRSSSRSRPPPGARPARRGHGPMDDRARSS